VVGAESLHHFFHSLLGEGSTTAAHASARELARIGHTMGIDLLSGLLTSFMAVYGMKSMMGRREYIVDLR
jgi:hypothetical protein